MTSPYGDASGYPTRPSSGNDPLPGLGPAPSPGYPGWTDPQAAGAAYPQPGYPQPGFAPSGDYPAGGYPPVGFDPNAPFGRDPRTGAPYSDKSRVAAGLLQILPAVFVMPIGVGRFYMRSTGVALSQLVLFLVSLPLMLVLIGFPMLAAVWLWVVIDGVVLLLGGGRDGRGRPLRP